MLSFTIAHAENPLAKPAVEQRPFAGNFVGENISLDMNYDAAQEAYTGWLTFKGNRYACGGWVNNSQLSGQFVADGQKYPFSIGINGNDITITSAGQNYPLKRQGVLAPPGGGNPLGGGGAAPNPLGGGAPVNPNPAPPVDANAVGGIGIRFEQNADGELVIAAVLPGSPAANAGLKAGLYLMAVDGKSVEKLAPEQLRAMVMGPVGSKLTLTVEDENDKQQDVVLARADIAALMGGNQPQPGPGPQPGPVGPGPAPAPGPQPGPFGPGGNNDAAPAWLKPGVRLTFWSGSASIPGATTVLAPDDQGNWTTPDGRRWSEQNNPGSGGYGYQQLTVASVNNGTAVVDAKNYLINPENQNVTLISATGYVLPVNNGGDYWMDPRQLAQMQNGPGGVVRVWRGPYKLQNQTFNVVRIITKVDTGWTQSTYDSQTGLMISTGSSTMGQGQMIAGPNGTSTWGGQTNNITQGFFVNMRQVTLPWIGQQGPREVAQLRGMEFGGTYVTEIPQVPSMKCGFSMRWEIGKIDAYSVTFRQTTAIDYGNGGQPQPNVADRAGSLANMWIDPQILGKVQQGQVLDEDPYTKHRLSVAGVQNGSVIFADQSPAEQSAASYDMRTGLINGMQVKQTVGIGSTTISLQRTR